jgi:hypothetical protein
MALFLVRFRHMDVSQGTKQDAYLMLCRRLVRFGMECPEAFPVAAVFASKLPKHIQEKM